MNKTRVLLYALVFGILVGVTFFSNPTVTGQVSGCYLENQQCDCEEYLCYCGNTTVAKSYCTQDLNTLAAE